MQAKDAEHKKSALRQSFKRRYFTKSPQHRIYVDNEDVTPLPLQPIIYEEGQEKQIGVYDMNESALRSSRSEKSVNVFFGPQNMSKFQTELHNQTLEAQSMLPKSHFTTTLNVDDDVLLIESDYNLSEASEDVYELIEEAKPDILEESKVPTQVTIVLTETPTFYILDWPSSTALKGSEEGDAAEADNEKYEYITTGKGRNRKVISAEVQTLQILTKTRNTEILRVHSKHKPTFASNWDMYDTYAAEKPVTQDDISEDSAVVLESAHSFDSIDITSEERQMVKLLQNTKFQEALIAMERLLANNNFNTEQERFRGLLDPDPFREGINYNYSLKLLWTFTNHHTEGKCVVALDWNPLNEDILAVGYGKFYFTDSTTGIIMIWNIKNPVQPERHYDISAAITSLQFSKQHCNLLAIGLADGKVEILDISKREKTVLHKCSPKDSMNFEPVWQVTWHKSDDYHSQEDQLFAAGHDGLIRRYRRTGTLAMKCQRIMSMIRAEGHIKGIETIRKCSASGIPIAKYSSALVLTSHPVDPNIYFVGTGEGVIHRCSTDYYHQHLDLFRAHAGPMYQMKFSPFCDKLFLTCGDDWTIRIWCDGIFEPLLELTKTMESVQGAAWSPTHSTIIASICGNDIYIWDIQRKAYLPQSVTPSPTDCRNTVIEFTSSGRCLVVGDIEGNVHVFALEDMPFPAFFQEDLLVQALKKSMVTKPALLKQIKKMGKLSFDKSEFASHFR